MLTGAEIAVAICSFLLAFLLLADVRDECLRKLKPLIVKALENAGVLTQDEYRKRSGIDEAELAAYKAANQFSQQVSLEQQANQPSSVLPLQPSPSEASSSSPSSSSASLPSSSSIHATSAEQAAIEPSPDAVIAAELAAGSKSPKEVDQDAVEIEKEELQADLANERAELSRPQSRNSRSRKQKDDSKEDASQTPIVNVIVPATPNQSKSHNFVSPSQQENDEYGQESSLNQSSASAPLPVPIIAGYPITMLTVRRSLDGEISVEEYFNDSGEKVAWRRGNIWDIDFIYTFTQGLEFMKYGSWGSPHVRKIRFVLDEVTKQLRLDWGTGSILLDDVTEIRPGKSTPVFKRYANDPSAPDHACFSILTAKRSLDLSILVSKTQRIQEKRDLLVFGLGEVTGTRPSQGPVVNGKPLTPEMHCVPIPYQKVVESILANDRSRAFGPNGVLANSLILGSMYRDEYSLSTRASQQQASGVPQTPTSYYRSQQSSPAGAHLTYGGRPFLQPPGRQSLLHTSYMTPSQMQMHQRHLLPYQSAPPMVSPTNDSTISLPPPSFQTIDSTSAPQLVSNEIGHPQPNAE